MKDNKDEHLAEEKPTLADKLKKASEDAMEGALVGKIYGVGSQDASSGSDKPDTLQTQVVTSALTQMNSMVHEANMLAKAKELEVIQARKEADEARTNLYTTQLAQIQSMQKGLIAATDKAAEQGTPEAAMAVIEKYGAMMEKLKPQPSPVSEPPVGRGVSDSVSIEIEKMREGHEFKMKTLELQIANQNQQFNIQMLQFQEDSRRRWREYEDSKGLKEDALGGFQDLAGAISAGISRDRGIPTQDEEVLQASVGSFPCEFCKTKVPVSSGATQATCPNPECKATYNIKQK